MAGHQLASIATPFTGSIAPYYNGTLSDSSRFSNGSIEPVADFIAQNIYTERKQEFVIALSKLIPVDASTGKISPLIKFLMTPPENFGNEEDIKKMLYKSEGYFSRFFGKESWKDWSEDRTDLGYVVINMAGILSTGPGRSVTEFVATLDVQRLANANKQAASFLEKIKPVAVSPKQKLGKRDIAHNQTADLDAQKSEPHLLEVSRRDTLVAQKVGTEFLVNTYTNSYQTNPVIIQLTDNRFVIAWSGVGQGGATGIYSQVFEMSENAVPKKIGSEFQINANKDRYQSDVSLVQLTGSRFVATWQEGVSIFGQFFNISGNLTPQKVGAAFSIGTSEYYTVSNHPKMTRLADNLFMVTWDRYKSLVDEEAGSQSINGQLFSVSENATPQKVGIEFPINTYTANDQKRPVISSLPNNRFIVAWDSIGQDGSYEGIYGQLFSFSENATPQKVGAEFRINTYTPSGQFDPRLVSLANSQFMVSWSSGGGQDGSQTGVFGQLFDASANATPQKIGSEFQINTYTEGFQSRSSIAHLIDNRFVATWHSYWQDDDSSCGVYSQVFEISGSTTPKRLGFEFQVNSYIPGDQLYPYVSRLTDNRFIVAWGSDNQDGSSSGIYAQIFELMNGPDPTTTIPVLTTTRPTTSTTTTIARSTTTIPSTSTTKIPTAGNLYVKPIKDQFNLFNPSSDGARQGTVSMALQGNKVIATVSKPDQDIERSDVYSQWISVEDISALQLIGVPMRDNTFTARDQGYASTAAFGSTAGVIWSSLDQDGSSYGIFAQLYRLDGAGLPALFGAEIPINSYKDNLQGSPSIALFSGDRMLATWHSNQQDGSNTGIYAQAFQIEASGVVTKLGNEFRVNTQTVGEQIYPKVISLQGDLAFIHWRSEGQDGSGKGVYGQVIKLGSIDAPVFIGQEFRINTHTQYDQGYSSAAVLENNQLIVAWSSDQQDGSSYGIYAQLFKISSTGTPEKVGAEFIVNTGTIGVQGSPSVASVEGGFIITWHSEYGDGSSSGIFGQLFKLGDNITPIKVDTEFQVNTLTQGSQVYPAVIPINKHVVLVAWEDKPETSASAISAQLFNISIPDVVPTTPPVNDDNHSGSNFPKGVIAVIVAVPIMGLIAFCCKGSRGGRVGPANEPRRERQGFAQLPMREEPIVVDYAAIAAQRQREVEASVRAYDERVSALRSAKNEAKSRLEKYKNNPPLNSNAYDRQRFEREVSRAKYDYDKARGKTFFFDNRDYYS